MSCQRNLENCDSVPKRSARRCAGFDRGEKVTHFVKIQLIWAGLGNLYDLRSRRSGPKNLDAGVQEIQLDCPICPDHFAASSGRAPKTIEVYVANDSIAKRHSDFCQALG